MQTPGSADEVGKLAIVYHANFFYDQADTCYKLAIKLDHKNWIWHYYLSLIKEEFGDSPAVIEHLNKVIEINPAVPFAWFRLGNALLKQNSQDSAEIAFKKAIDASQFFYQNNLPGSVAYPLKAYARLNLSRLYLDQGKYDSAKEQLDVLIKNHPDFGAAYRLLGQFFTTLGDSLKGIEYTVRAGDFESYVPPSDPMFNQLILNSRDSRFILKHIDIALKGNNFEWAEYLCRYIIDFDPQDITTTGKYIHVLLLK